MKKNMKDFFKRTKKIVTDTKKGSLTETPFNIIFDSDILTKEDIKSLDPLKGELKETFVKAQVFRTRTEMEVSVLNEIKHPTASSKYWQATREQNVMFEQLVFLSYAYRKNLIKIKIIQRDIDGEDDKLKKELRQIELEKKMFMLKGQEKTAKDRIREIKAWSEIKEREAKNMSEEELGDVDNHQLISYTHRWIRQYLKMGDNGSPSENQNLVGQLVSGLNACKAKGVLDSVLSQYNKEVQKIIVNI